MQMQTLTVAVGALLIFIGMMRLIYINTANPGNVSLTRWALTGGTIEIIKGLITGTVNWLRLQPDDNSRVCLIIYLGVFVIYLAL